MIINNLDLGGSHPWHMPIAGQEIGDVLIEGAGHAVWPRGSIVRKEAVTFKVQAWQGLGGAAANSLTAANYLLQQLWELANNPDAQPVFIQWSNTAQPGVALAASDLKDGWWIIDDVEPDYSNYVVTGLVDCKFTATFVAAAPPRRLALAYAGGGLSSNFSGSAVDYLAAPIATTFLEGFPTTPNSGFRVGAEGSIQYVGGPIASPSPIVLSTTIANIFKGNVRVYDTINTGTNPVPTSSGTFVNTNWVQVFGPDHNFIGDCVITNGLLLLIFQATVQQVCAMYLWQTAISPANWQLVGGLNISDNASNGLFLQSFSLGRVSPEECSIVGTSAGLSQVVQWRVRLQRGRYEGRLDVVPQSVADASAQLVYFNSSNANLKIIYNSSKVQDLSSGVSDPGPGTTTDYGYGAAISSSASFPYIYGLLYQNQPTTNQPGGYPGTGTVISGGEAALSVNAQRSYGFFAFPYGVSGGYSVANLQRECETGTLSGGFVSIADAAASAGNTAKLPSGTAVGAATDENPYHQTAAGQFDIWFRVRVTSNVSGTTQIRLGLRDATSGWVAGGFTDYAPSAFTTSYAWYRVATGYSPNAAHVHSLRAEGVTNAAATDFFIDEAVQAPKMLFADNRGPQELWQQFMYDRTVRMVPM